MCAGGGFECLCVGVGGGVGYVPGHDVLQGMSFQVLAGKKIAVVRGQWMWVRC